MPRRVVPIWSFPSLVSPAWSRSMWYGMIRCAFALIRRPERSTPLARRSSSSSVRTFGSITTPLPIAHSLPGYRMPDGIRWNFHFTSSRTIVWPALLPPWKRITRSAFSARRSVILPLPSSPHWAPMMTMPAISDCSLRSERRAPRARLAVRGLGVPLARRLRERVRGLQPPVLAEHRLGIAAGLVQPRHRAVPDLLAQRVVALQRHEVRGEQDRLSLLVARVDDRVELLEDPRRRLLGADVVDVQEVDRAQPVDELVERVLRVVLVGVAQQRQQPRERVDRDRPLSLHRRLGDQHGQRRLAGADVAGEPQAAPGVELLRDRPRVLAHLAHHVRVRPLDGDQR